jgi:hypothetical protein
MKRSNTKKTFMVEITSPVGDIKRNKNYYGISPSLYPLMFFLIVGILILGIIYLVLN